MGIFFGILSYKKLYKKVIYLPINKIKSMEITIAPNYFMFGISWFSPDEEYAYSELNIYILCIHIKVMW
jgi:hypothetical protein